MQKRNKKAAIELSVNTIVVIVLAMSMLILGLVLVKNIFSGATDITKMTNEQVKNQVSQLFGDDRKLVVYPDSRQVEIKQGQAGGFGIGIKNLRSGSSTDTKFSYEVVASDPDLQKKCGVSQKEIESLMTTGRSESGLPLASGEIVTMKVLFTTDVGTPLCTVRFRVNVKVNNENYASDFMDVTFKA
jgi:hypothetical protein